MGLRAFITHPNALSSVFIDRDPENFRLSEVAVQRRRRVFWEIYVYDMWMVRLPTCATTPNGQTEYYGRQTTSHVRCTYRRKDASLPRRRGSPKRL